jgi:hypothetical protein
MIGRSLCVFVCIVLFNNMLSAQSDSMLEELTVPTVSTQTIDGLQKRYNNLESKLDKQSVKVLNKMQRKEDKLLRKLNTIDSNKAQQLFTNDIKKRYTDLQTDLSKQTDKLNRFPLKEYIPGIDSVQTSLGFLMDNPNLPADKLQQLQSLTTKLNGVQEQLQKANNIQAFVKEREAALKEQLMNTGLAKQLTSINKDVYYYQKQFEEYKSLLNDKENLKQKLLETVRTLPAFQKFWQKNSYLAALFPMPANAGTTQALAGLQTRASVQSMVAQRIGSAAGMNPQQYFQGQTNAAQSQLNQLKDKLNKFSNGSGSSDMTMPDFKPSNQKTKSFFQRLEYGFNIQSQPAQYFLPSTSDLALTLGYKLSDNKRMGIGASYKIGWGNAFKDIHISSEGIGLRSYIDVKAKGSIWLSGGFEYNYLSSFRSLQDLHNNIDVWQRSALMGLSKKYKVGKKAGNMQLLYDFLHNQQTPHGTALKFRVGWTF